MNNFTKRAITGFFFIAFISALTLYDVRTFMFLIALIGGLGLVEYYRIMLNKTNRVLQMMYILMGVAIITSSFWLKNHIEIALFSLVLLVGLSFIISLLSAEKVWKTVPLLISGLFYIALPLMLFSIAVMKSDGSLETPQNIYKPFLALNLFVLIWCSDTFAYLCGKAFGKHKLFEKISPKKTVEGFVGAILLTVAFSFLLSYWFKIPFKINVLVALVSVVFGTLGDLVESQLKREYGLKDSGNIIPGHGGILDRFDAFLIALPFTSACYYFLI